MGVVGGNTDITGFLDSAEYFFVSILRAILKGGGVEYSFRELLYTIKSGRSVVGYYEYER